MFRLLKNYLVSISLICSFGLTSKAATLHGSASHSHFLTLQDIESLTSSQEQNPQALKNLERSLNTISWGNKAKASAELQNDDKLNRKYFRVTQWNIERGFHIDQIKMILQNPEQYLSQQLINNPNQKNTASNATEIQSQIDSLRSTDVFILNEVDWGIARTNYKNIAAELAQSLDAEYVFVPEFVELNPELLKDAKAEYKGLHGNAIVSKFPIKAARILRLPICHDWFEEELEEKSPVEHVRRSATKVTIQEEILTEIRRGSRVALAADLLLPNQQIVTVVNVHLENRCDPNCRNEQLGLVLDWIKDNKYPVVFGGDLNNFENSAEATSVKRIILKRLKDPEFLIRTTATWFNPYALPINAASATIGFARKHHDPTTRGIPIILPNKARKIFSMLEKFEFSDHNQFDFSGDKELSYMNKKGFLSNSNQRAKKGFIETYKFKRSFKVGEFKIDWLFVKPLLIAACDDKDFEDLDYNCKQYFPAFGRTLRELNYSQKTGEPLSDHNPVTVQIVI